MQIINHLLIKILNGMKKTKETTIMCPQCGTELAIAGGKVTVAADDSMPARQPQLPRTAQERIEALRRAGADVSCLFAMQGANGGEHVVSNKDGRLTVLADNDPIFDYIARQGTVPNRRLFRRFVMAQMFHMLSYVPYGESEPAGPTEMIHRLGYEYQWKMLIRELHAQMKMDGKDTVNFSDRNLWFNAGVAVAMAQDYIARLKAYVETLPERKCKGVPYKRVGGRDIFVEDLPAKLICPLKLALAHIICTTNTAQLYEAVKRFDGLRVKMKHETPQCKEWVDAYKGSGAFFTMQNLIRFHNCVAIDDFGKQLDKYQSLTFLSAKAEQYKNGGGWRLLAMLKKMLDDNGIDVKKKMDEWRKRK